MRWPFRQRDARTGRLLFSLLLVMLLSGCESLGYYRQGIAGQFAFYGAREPIAKVLARADLPAETRHRLELVPQITAFAKSELQLPVKGQYRDYVQLDHPVVLWSVFAAPELSLQPYRWCYFFHAICVEYRGYFSEADAKKYAAKLRAQGYDVHIGGVSAFSSLGLLDDPVTSVLTSYPDDLLASVLFHELAHSVLYVKDDTAFNESFASAVADEGLSRWLAARKPAAPVAAAGGAAATTTIPAAAPAVTTEPTTTAATAASAHPPAAIKSAVLEDFRQQQAVLTEVALAIRADLAALYETTASDAQKRARKQEILAGAVARYRQRCGAVCPYAGWFVVAADGSGLSNARLNAVATYEHLVPAFAALLQAHDGDLAAFYKTVTALGDMPVAQREHVLRALQGATDKGSL